MTLTGTIELKNCTLSIYKDEIILAKIKNDAEVNLESSVRIVNHIIELANHRPFKLIIDASNILASFEKNARNHFATNKEYNQLRIKTAVILNNLPIRLLTNFYQKAHLKKNNLKIVKDMKEALVWINS